jgi:ethanolamine permease
MSVLGAIISYIFTLISFVVLRSKHPKMHRPYISPLGVTGAITGLMIAGFTLVLMFTNAGYRIGLLGCIAVYALSCVFYIYCTKSQVHESPEETFASTIQTKNHPHVTSNESISGRVL